MEQLETDMRSAAGWKPSRSGLKFQIVGVYVHLLGMVLSGFVVGMVLSGFGIKPGDFCVTIFFIGSVLALLGPVLVLVSLFWLARIPAATKVGRWAPWGMCSLPASIGILVTIIAFNAAGLTGVSSTRLTSPWLFLSLLAAVLLCIGMFCVSHILRATANCWNAVALGRQFLICITALCGLVLLTVAFLLALTGNLPPATFRRTTESYLNRTWPDCAIVPWVGYLLLMTWHLVLAHRLLARIAVANIVPEPQLPKSS